jgi:hypothetical protein
MERSLDETTPSHVRAALWVAAGPVEIVAVAATAIGAWRLTLGWDWSSVPTPDPVRNTTPQSAADWVTLAVAVMLCTGWLALRGRAVAGTVAIAAPLVILSGWRMAVSGVFEWPISLASLVFSLSVICLVAASAGAWARGRRAARDERAAKTDGVSVSSVRR